MTECKPLVGGAAGGNIILAGLGGGGAGDRAGAGAYTRQLFSSA